jgi:hypothetical protein
MATYTVDKVIRDVDCTITFVVGSDGTIRIANGELRGFLDLARNVLGDTFSMALSLTAGERAGVVALAAKVLAAYTARGDVTVGP